MAAMAMSDYSILLLSLDTFKPIWQLPKAHNGRIEQIIFKDNMLITCSNDKYIKLHDF
jgi:hypothetical protein